MTTATQTKRGMSAATSRSVHGADRVFDVEYSASDSAVDTSTFSAAQPGIKALKTFDPANHDGYLTVHVMPLSGTPVFKIDFFAAIDARGEEWAPKPTNTTDSAIQGHTDVFFNAAAFLTAVHVRELSGGTIRVVVIAA